jgi:hypothetical protein
MAVILAHKNEKLSLDYAEYAGELEHYVDTLEDKVKKSNPPGPIEFKLIHLHESIANMNSSYVAMISRCEENLLCNTEDLNDRLIKAERLFLDEDGIPGRTWYKHVVYAPGLWAGYGADTFPSLTEAIDDTLKRHKGWNPVFDTERKIANMIMNISRLFDEFK